MTGPPPARRDCDGALCRLPTCPPPPDQIARSGRVYGLSALDARGRLADRVVMAALGWTPGTRLQFRLTGGLITVDTDLGGAFAVTGQGHPQVPATLRHWCRLTAGDRLLLAADPTARRLLVYPPAALDRLTSAPDTADSPSDGTS